jgi:hypothetical protein
MIKEKIKDKGYSYDIHKYYVNKRKRTGCVFYLIPFLILPVVADELTFKFKSPSFSGIGTSAHYLTIDNQEYTRREAVKAEIKALKEAVEREEENTTLARFIRNFESRIFAQLSRQLVEQLFGENPATEGSFTLFDNIITWTSDGTYITLTIYNTLDESTTEITIPIGDFGFGS